MEDQLMNILILGVTGMLGHSLVNTFIKQDRFKIYGTMRNAQDLKYFPKTLHPQLFTHIDILDSDSLLHVFTKAKPNIVINCVGIIKQLTSAEDPLTVLPINAMFPHRLARLCSLANARLIHISTDCVFSGKKGFYAENDPSDAEDLYGKSKYIGELHNYPHAVTLRTSIIGHELHSQFALVDWFLSQNGSVKGYKNAVFSGMPTVELANIIGQYVIPNESLSGLYHVAVDPINKYDLLNLIAKIYSKKITIIPDSSIMIDRSLNASLFNKTTKYVPTQWPELITLMQNSKEYVNV